MALPPPEVRRGVPFQNLVAGIGRVFRVHPNTLELDMKTKLFDSSTRCDKIAAFVSHSWGSPGYQKYFSLLIYEAGLPAMVAAMVAGLAMLLGQKFGRKLPFMVVEGAFDPVFEVYELAKREQDPAASACCYCPPTPPPPPLTLPYVLAFAPPRYQESQPWEFLCSFLVGITVFVTYPLYGPVVREKLFFLDCMCIHQTDIEKKMAGIKGLGGFVLMSERLYIMWDQDYFSRLWCVYELAVYKALHPGKNNVDILPLRGSVAVLLLIPIFFAGFLLYIILFPSVAQWGIYTFYAAAMAASCVVFTGAAVAG
jgi:hypothetical protein